MSKNIGIDLGTTHSLVAAVLDGKARVLLDEHGEALVPSAVRFEGGSEDDGAFAVGRPALSRAHLANGVTFTSFKRFMGRAPSEVAEEAKAFGYELVEGDDRVIRFRHGELEFTPVELSAMILRELWQQAGEVLLTRPGGVVITVPAYFDDAQRQATRDAARLANLEVLRLLNEPTAAAIAYGLQQGADGQRVAVYDLGGGTFDISILELSEGVFQVLSTAGDTQLGGDDFDQALARVLQASLGLGELSGIEWRMLVRAAEAAKRRLTDADQTTIEIEHGGAVHQVPISRAQFDQLVAPIVERTADSVKRALSDAELSAADIDEVVLVGGSTRVPYVRAFVQQLFGGKAPHVDIDPDQVVAIGASMQADILSGASQLTDDLLLLDILPLSLGIETMGGVVERIIPRVSTIPATASQTFTTHVDGQTAVDIHVVQGEREMVRDNRSLGRFRLTGIPAMPAGIPRIKVEFTVDADGILSVSATEKSTGVAARIKVEPSYGLSDDEIEQMLEDAIDHAEDDFDERLLIEARVEAEGVKKALERAIADDAGLLEGDEGDRFQAVLAELSAAMDGKDRQRISALTKKLDETSAAFAQRRIERDLALALEGRDADDVGKALGID
ncbi:MAG: Fe-S protein assembly chaperone HscA [Alphaproteobacteria bacterium]|nr:Fe-S protein assembly chaperone HscA [Alphaproteobacteria bacterium]